MKKIATLFALLPVASVMYGQAITINATDMPVPTADYNMMIISSTSAPVPVVGTSSLWDYSTYSGTATVNSYPAETNPFFTAAGIDVYASGFKTLTTGLGYDLFSEIDFNATNIKESGIEIERQEYDLFDFTGSTSDSLIFPAQTKLLTTPRVIIQFPMTAGSSWTSYSRHVTDFFLTVASASLSNTPGQQVYYTHRTDTICGWGKLKVYTASGASIQYDVLMDKVAQYNVDSFYLAGSPAPPTLLTAFGLTQNQKNDSNYRYHFFRKGSFNYLMSFSFGSDATYTTPVGKFVHTDNITPAGVSGLDNGYATVVFPNPSMGNFINLLVQGRGMADANYFVTDITGRTIKSGRVEMLQGAAHIEFDEQLSAGNYTINLFDKDNNRIVSESFSVSR